MNDSSDAAPATVISASAAPPASYLDWARVNRGSGWLYLAGAVAIVAFWLVASAVILLVGVLASGAALTSSGGVQTDPEWIGLAVTLATFLPFLVATPFVVAVLHGRPWLTVITPFRRLNWRLVALGAGAWVVANLVVSLPTLFARDEGVRFTFDPSALVPVLLVALTLLFVQTTAEELFFRGYLLQWCAISPRLRSPLVLGLISGVLFTIPHLANPEVAGLTGLDLVVGAVPYFAIGFGLAVVSVRSGTIEVAIGTHFINNFIGVVVITADNSALGTTSVWVDATPNVTEAAIGSVVAVAILLALTWRIRGSGEVRPLPAALPGPQPVAAAPGGWFPDPLGRSTYRYWDGTRWTEHSWPPADATQLGAPQPTE